MAILGDAQQQRPASALYTTRTAARQRAVRSARVTVGQPSQPARLCLQMGIPVVDFNQCTKHGPHGGAGH